MVVGFQTIINARCACAREFTVVTLSVCVCVTNLAPAYDIRATIDNREVEGDWETRIRTYGDVTDDVPFGTTLVPKKMVTTLSCIVSYSAVVFFRYCFVVLPRGGSWQR